jgi:hypothetical protein
LNAYVLDVEKHLAKVGAHFLNNNSVWSATYPNNCCPVFDLCTLPIDAVSSGIGDAGIIKQKMSMLKNRDAII